MICIGLTGCFNDQLMRETFQQQPLRFLLTLQFYEKDEGMGFPGGNSPPFWLSFPFLFFFYDRLGLRRDSSDSTGLQSAGGTPLSLSL